MPNDTVNAQLKNLPETPGVYLMKDAGGTIIYVGKAVNLRNRVRSYFTGQSQPPKTEKLVERVADLEFFITKTEEDALMLENNLIKRHHPHFNVRLKDDKTFPYLKITLNEEWPRIVITRRMEDDGARYFGPFTSAGSVRQTLKVLKGIFPFRSCSREITGHDPRACLDFHIGSCVAPCIGNVSKQEYGKVVRQVIQFLEGRQERIVRDLKSRMEKKSEELDFEKAAVLRDQVRALERVIAGQKIATTVRGEQDVIAFAAERDRAFVQVFFIRGSKLIGRESFTLQGTGSEPPARIMTSFIEQFYNSVPHIPPLLLLQHPVEDKEVIENWLKGKRGGRVEIRVPDRGSKKKLLDIVAENSENGLRQLKIKQQAAPNAVNDALAEIAAELDLPGPPERMECYDISNFQGRSSVGSMVVFEKGKPRPPLYRRFRIKTIEGANDYGSLKEVLTRRFKRVNPENGESAGTWAALPDLVLIDGGRGQLNAALEAMKEVGAENIPAAGLAKEHEEIFLPDKTHPIRLPGSSPGLQMLQRLRDEAHRFAIGYHRNVRKRDSFGSLMDSIPGIGPRRKKALLRQFGSVSAIRNATAEELAATRGMTQSLAEKVKEYL